MNNFMKKLYISTILCILFAPFYSFAGSFTAGGSGTGKMTITGAASGGGGDVYQAGNNVFTGTNSFSGPTTVTSTNTYFNATGDFGVNITSNPGTTSAAYMFDVSHSTSNGVVIYDNSGKGQGGGNLLTLITTNTFNHAFVMRIIRNNGNDSNGDIRIDSPNPNFETIDTSQLGTDGSGKYEAFSNNSDHLNITGRNGADTAFQNIVGFNRLEGPYGGGMVIYSTGSLKFSNGVGSYEGFVPANSFTSSGSWLWTLPLTSNNTGQVLIQTGGSPTYQLAFSTGGTDGQVLTHRGVNPQWETRTGSIGMTFDGNGSAIVAGSTRTVTVPFGCTISSWTVLADQSGSISVEIKKASFANYPTLTSMSTGGNSPSLTSAQKNAATPSSWSSTSVSAGDSVSFVINSASTVQVVNIVLWVTKQ